MQLVVFNIGREQYAIDSNFVNGIEKMMNITRVPNAHYYISGLANLRGTIITIIDLGKYLNIESSETKDNIIIVDYQDEKIGLIVDNVKEVVDIDENYIEKTQNESSFICGILNLDGKITTILKASNILK